MSSNTPNLRTRTQTQDAERERPQMCKRCVVLHHASIVDSFPHAVTVCEVTATRSMVNVVRLGLFVLLSLGCGSGSSGDAGVDGTVDALQEAGACPGTRPSCYGSCNIDDLIQGTCVDGGWVCNDQCPCIGQQQRPPDLCYACDDGGLGPQEVCNLVTLAFECPDGSASTTTGCAADASTD